jgi:hypothetical protein
MGKNELRDPRSHLNEVHSSNHERANTHEPDSHPLVGVGRNVIFRARLHARALGTSTLFSPGLPLEITLDR